MCFSFANFFFTFDQIIKEEDADIDGEIEASEQMRNSKILL